MGFVLVVSRDGAPIEHIFDLLDVIQVFVVARQQVVYVCQYDTHQFTLVGLNLHMYHPIVSVLSELRLAHPLDDHPCPQTRAVGKSVNVACYLIQTMWICACFLDDGVPGWSRAEIIISLIAILCALQKLRVRLLTTV